MSAPRRRRISPRRCQRLPGKPLDVCPPGKEFALAGRMPSSRAAQAALGACPSPRCLPADCSPEHLLAGHRPRRPGSRRFHLHRGSQGSSPAAIGRSRAAIGPVAGRSPAGGRLCGSYASGRTEAVERPPRSAGRRRSPRKSSPRRARAHGGGGPPCGEGDRAARRRRSAGHERDRGERRARGSARRRARLAGMGPTPRSSWRRRSPHSASRCA